MERDPHFHRLSFLLDNYRLRAVYQERQSSRSHREQLQQQFDEWKLLNLREPLCRNTEELQHLFNVSGDTLGTCMAAHDTLSSQEEANENHMQFLRFYWCPSVRKIYGWEFQSY